MTELVKTAFAQWGLPDPMSCPTQEWERVIEDAIAREVPLGITSHWIGTLTEPTRSRMFEQAKHDPGGDTLTQSPEKPLSFSIGYGDILISCESESYKQFNRHGALVSKLSWLTQPRLNEAYQLEGKKKSRDQAVSLYEQSVADWEMSEQPYRRLRIIYAEKGQWEDATRVCTLYLRVLEYVKACGWPGEKTEYKANCENRNNEKRAEYLSWIEKYQNPSWIAKHQGKKQSKKRSKKRVIEQ